MLGGGFVGEIEMIDGGDLLRVDQAHLETVIPSVGGRVRVLAGPAVGCLAELLALDVERFKARVRVDLRGGEMAGREVALEYEEVCKVE